MCSQPALSQKETAPQVFRYHIPNEPHSLDPSKLTSTDASYFFNNVMRGLYSYSNREGLKPEGAKACRFETPTRLACELSNDFLWSDGSRVEAQDYIRSFRRLVSSKSKNPSVELLKNVRNAIKVNAGEVPAEQLGISAPTREKIVIEFDLPDPDFLYKLTASVLVPVRTETFPEKPSLQGALFNGPYVVKEWVSGRRLRLEPNPFYKRGHAKRPPVEVLFIDDDQTALTLYDQKTLSFLRRLPLPFVAQFKDRNDFHLALMARFDYIGFGDELKSEADLRHALSYSADFRELQKLLDALAGGIPGCPGLKSSHLDKKRCVEFDLKKAKTHFAKVSPEARTKRYKFYFSKLGGDNVKLAAEWFQAQWKKNLGLTIDLEQTEQSVYLQTLRSAPPAIFRKGVGLERPTCLAAVETFGKGGSENFIKLADPEFERLISTLAQKPRDKKICGDSIQWLLDRAMLIPLGEVAFALLANPRWKGWELNEMNQLDLANLQFRP